MRYPSWSQYVASGASIPVSGTSGLTGAQSGAAVTVPADETSDGMAGPEEGED